MAAASGFASAPPDAGDPGVQGRAPRRGSLRRPIHRARSTAVDAAPWRGLQGATRQAWAGRVDWERDSAMPGTRKPGSPRPRAVLRMRANYGSAHPETPRVCGPSPAGKLNLDQLGLDFGGGLRNARVRQVLRVPPEVEVGHVVHAGNGAVWSAILARVVLAPDILD